MGLVALLMIMSPVSAFFGLPDPTLPPIPIPTILPPMPTYGGEISSISLQTANPVQGDSITLAVGIHNTGDLVNSFIVTASSLDSLLGNLHLPAAVTLSPGESSTVYITANAGEVAGQRSVRIYLTGVGVSTSMDHSFTVSEKELTVLEWTTLASSNPLSFWEEMLEKDSNSINKIRTEVSKPAINDLDNSMITYHVVGEESAQADHDYADEAVVKERAAFRDIGDSMSIIGVRGVGKALTAITSPTVVGALIIASAEEAVVQALCNVDSMGSAIPEVNKYREKAQLMKNKKGTAPIANLEEEAFVNVFYGGPEVNTHSEALNDRLKKSGVPYFDGNFIILPNGESLGNDYGMLAFVPELEANINPNNPLTPVEVSPEHIQKRVDNGNIRSFTLMAAGTNRQGTNAAEEAYVESLVLISETANLVKGYLCGGDSEAALGSIATSEDLHALLEKHAREAADNPEIADFTVEFIKSYMLLMIESEGKINIEPTVLIVKWTGSTYTPVKVYQ